MKTLQFISPSETIKVNYLTDLIGNNEELTVYQIKDMSIDSTGSVVLGDLAIAAGLFTDIDEYSLGAFKEFATDNEYSLKIYENGEDVVDLVDSSATDFVTYAFPEQAAAAVIDTEAHTVSIGVEGVADLTALIAAFNLSINADADISDVAQVSEVTENDFSSTVVYTITAEDGTTEQDWDVDVVSVDTDIAAYSFAEQTGAATIDNEAHTVAIEVANGTNPSALVATFGLSYGAAADVSDVAQVSATTANDFSSPVVYTITADDSSTEQDWTVTVTVAA